MNNYYAKIDWDAETPISKHYDDIYYSTESGILESQYVFLQHNNLAQKFTQIQNTQTYIIAETGFGAGINFFTTCMLWNQAVQNNAKLHYVSIEKHPISPSDLKQILSHFTEFNQLQDSFLEQYTLLLPGYHRINLANNIYFTLIIGDVNDVLVELDFKADTWFLDGFSPSKNDQMWNSSTIAEIARLSKLDTSFATFTASSQVRRELINHGFNVKKDKGFGKKREMLYGELCDEIRGQHTKHFKPFFYRQTYEKHARIAVIGAGISGAATAYSLAIRGYQVTVFEQNSSVAEEASGNYQGMLYGTWSIFGGSMMELSSSGYRFSNNLIKKKLVAKDDYDECGIIQLDHNDKQAIRNQQLINHSFPDDFISSINKNKIPDLSGIKIHADDGVLFPKGMWVKPINFVKQLLKHPNISLRLQNKVNEITYENNSWQLISNNNDQHIFDMIVICNSYMVDKFNVTNFINLRKIRGQTTTCNFENNLKMVICGDGYITPASNNKFTIGATFDFNNLKTNILTKDHLENINNFDELIPEITNKIDIAEVGGKASIRSSYNDYLPVVGPVAKYKDFINDYSKLSKDKNSKFTKNCNYHPNLFVNVGHGSKGILTAPICAEIIADYIDNSALPCSESLRQALHPNRILVKQLVKNTKK